VTVGDPIEWWLELEGVFTIPGFGDVELAGDLGWEPGAGLVHLRRLNDSQVWRAGGDCPPGRARRGGRAVAVSCRAVHPPSAGPRRNDRGRVPLREPARYRP
jgi:hypothetical protein